VFGNFYREFTLNYRNDDIRVCSQVSEGRELLHAVSALINWNGVVCECAQVTAKVEANILMKVVVVFFAHFYHLC
jgi:hypothetical protein